MNGHHPDAASRRPASPARAVRFPPVSAAGGSTAVPRLPDIPAVPNSSLMGDSREGGAL